MVLWSSADEICCCLLAYSVTLESIGPSLQLPDACKKPELSPLKITWTSDMKSVDLEVPEKLLAH